MREEAAALRTAGRTLEGAFREMRRRTLDASIVDLTHRGNGITASMRREFRKLIGE
jgi:hypothetical protein